ncbi:MAG: hypothetical protein EZS28_009081 [Streblomastix strix]|uniref:Transmembrane protein n=1 Tax=Streblomastix strix TaxID=222440 RepID=A0A5J4WKP8_9EUKA|nr:MAG: hypothetical protein EZS28_009081 [Streblomastix strix]
MIESDLMKMIKAIKIMKIVMIMIMQMAVQLVSMFNYWAIMDVNLKFVMNLYSEMEEINIEGQFQFNFEGDEDDYYEDDLLLRLELFLLVDLLKLYI